MLWNSYASVSAVPVMPDSFLYMRNRFWKVMLGQRLVLALDRHAFLRFDRLVQAVGPAAARPACGR